MAESDGASSDGGGSDSGASAISIGGGSVPSLDRLGGEGGEGGAKGGGGGTGGCGCDEGGGPVGTMISIDGFYDGVRPRLIDLAWAGLEECDEFSVESYQ